LTVTYLGTCAEAGVYSYIGIALYSNIPGWWSVKFILVETIIIIIGRTISVFAIYYLFAVCFKSRTIGFNELFFISWGGMIRGVIAFALILKIPHENSHTCPEGTKDCFTS
jgi:NhaP-type Na+/H+ or K+/H+ antiporter